MSQPRTRLLFVGLVALGLHSLFLFYQMPQRQIDPAMPLAMQRISVSLAQKQVVQPVQEKPKRARKHEVAPQSPQAELQPKSVQSRVATEVEPVVQVAEPQEIQQQQVPVPLEDEVFPGKTQNLAAVEPVASESITQESTTELASQVVQQATPLYQINPPHRNTHDLPGVDPLKGLSCLRFINDVGWVEELKIFTTSGHKVLDLAALKAVWRWQFRPGTRDGKPQPMWVPVPVRFQLQ